MIAERIRKAWLAANPEPFRGYTREFADHLEWRETYNRLRELLKVQAYESAVIQFLVPEGFDWALFHTNGGLTIHAWCGSRDDVFDDTPAEALLSAIEAATQKDLS